MEPEPLLQKKNSFQLGRFKNLKAQWYLFIQFTQIKHVYIIKIQYPYVPTNKPTRAYYIWRGKHVHLFTIIFMTTIQPDTMILLTPCSGNTFRDCD